MNQDIKKRWVAALRSGTYKQCKGSLCKNNEYCCLGVLCDILKKELNLNINHSLDEPTSLSYDDAYFTLPSKVREYAKITEVGDVYQKIDDVQYFALTTMNDDGISFDEIANIIESEL